jgi:Spy/CpxP family protein refolding chaperone
MSKTGIAVITFAVFAAVTFCSGLVSAQSAQDTTGVTGRAMSTQPEKRLMKMERSLNLTEEQKTKIKPILDEESLKIKTIREDAALTPDQKRAKVREIHSATYDQIKPVLTAEQQKKHDEMRKSARGWHKKGHFAASPTHRLERMNRALNLTEEQKSKIKPILEGESAKIKAIFDDQSLTKQQKRDKIREIHSTSYEQIKPILTAEQKQKHDELMKRWKCPPKQGKAGNQS